MNLIRWRWKRLLLLASCGTLLFLFFNYILKAEEPNGCGNTSETRPCLETLFPRVISALEALGLSAYLCYFSLWGALKLGGPLPWMSKAEVCLRNEELLHIDEGQLLKTFRRWGTAALYDSANGLYRVKLTDDGRPCEAYLYVFEEDKAMRVVRRVGWKNRLLPPGACEVLHCFPSSLIVPPLKELQFLGKSIAVPREGFEIQKYLFPDSWWKEVEPPKCAT
uniref:Putative secreted protein n=1 Tax=Ornithodoros turicata TaxID=34597 RepID=A0A2R5L789_9ACAR